MFCSCGSSKIENREKMLCSSCNRLNRKAASVKPSDNNSPINKFSVKGAKVNVKYTAKLKTWKRGKTCQAHFKHECSGDITCHHMHGRSNDSFFDEWAEENGIVLTLDDRFWMPLCTVAHSYITDNSEFAFLHGYSFKRITDKMFRKDTK